MLKSKKYFFVIAHNIRSCYNVGSILRTADSLGVDKVILSGYTSRPNENSKIKKTSLGAEEFVDWESCDNFFELIDSLKKNKFKIISLELSNNSVDIKDLKVDSSVALVLGNEVTGVEEQVLKISDSIVEIPMKGKKESMNVAVSFGIAAYTIKNKI